MSPSSKLEKQTSDTERVLVLCHLKVLDDGQRVIMADIFDILLSAVQ